ncbi:hypothetical protein NKJ28_00580 [Mesorhizobium sp. M0145]|uniref:hypothetical protein n=1 Tax=Mesorhizobium sp. M0145 TaxID=2956895 RepID=UPI00333B4BE9
MKKLNRRIAAAMDARVKASRKLSAVAFLVQQTCKHEIVGETEYRSPGLAAQRICLHCRLQEEGSHWSGGSTWSRHDHGKSILGNSVDRIITQIGRDEFYSFRLPVQAEPSE